MGDSLLGEIPVIGLLTGYFLHPRYRISRPGAEAAAFRLHKKRSFLETSFHIEKLEATVGEGEEMVVTLGVLMLRTCLLPDREEPYLLTLEVLATANARTAAPAALGMRDLGD